MNEVFEMLLSHRSIRKFKSKPIPEETIKWIISTAQYASTSDHMQSYSIIRIVDPSLKSRLMELSGNQSSVTTSALFLVFCTDLFRLKLATQLHGVNVRFDTADLLIAGTVDVALAAQNVFTAAESIGLGGVYIGGIRNHISEVSQTLNLPPLTYPVFGMCLGVPDEVPPQKPRLPMDLVFNIDTYPKSDKQLTEAYDEQIRVYYEQRESVVLGWAEKIGTTLHQGSQRRAGVGEFLIRQGFGLN